MQKSMLERLEQVWREPDYGIWEVRGPARHFTFSKMMAWVAFDRCVKSAERFGLDDAPLAPSGHRLVNMRFSLADIRRESDGRTYHALVRFRAVTETQ